MQALSEFFERNHKQLRPQWSSRHITKIEVRMTETETCEGRIQYFHRFVPFLYYLVSLTCEAKF